MYDIVLEADFYERKGLACRAIAEVLVPFGLNDDCRYDFNVAREIKG